MSRHPSAGARPALGAVREWPLQAPPSRLTDTRPPGPPHTHPGGLAALWTPPGPSLHPSPPTQGALEPKPASVHKQQA